MLIAEHVFNSYMAKVFEMSSEIDGEDILRANFIHQLQSALVQIVGLQNDRNRNRGERLLIPGEIPYLVTAFDDTMPFDADICLHVIPLYLASEYYRDSGNYDVSAYFHDQFVTAVNERHCYSAEPVLSVL